MRIARIMGREILDSRGRPTVEADVILEQGVMGRASVPSGASTGKFEACERRDHDKTRYAGGGVSGVVRSIRDEIQQALVGMMVDDQALIDTTLCRLDGTANKSRLGANALLAVSMACVRAHALAIDAPLHHVLNQGELMTMPVPMMNVLNGGMHADNNVDIQEFMIMPIGAPDFASAIQMGAEIFYALRAVLKQKGLATAVGDEGGFAPNLRSNKHALDLLTQAVETVGLTLGEDVVFALDCAASSFYEDNHYLLRSEQQRLSSDELIQYYAQLIQQYPVFSIEDGLDENDWSGWQRMTALLGDKIQLVGDDIFVTNAERLAQGVASTVANAILIKPNQIGTLTEVRKTMRLARDSGYRCIISHRSGETEDTFIADLAVATGCGQIKTGSLCRTDRVAKYNQLLRINAAEPLAYAGPALWARSALA